MSNRYANTVSSLSLLVAIGSGIYTGLANSRNQENIVLSIHRDYKAGLDDAQPSMIVADREALNGLKARYTAVLSNTSNSASVSIVSLVMTVTQFTGWGVVQIPSPYIQEDGRDQVRTADDHNIVKFPLKLAPGETLDVEIFPVITVDKKFGARVKGGLPQLVIGFSSFGFRDRDMFGNEGNDSLPDNFESKDISGFHQPRIQVRVESGRGYSYEGSADWYSKVFSGASSR